MTKNMPFPKHGLSVRYLGAEARDVDWGDLRDDMGEPYRVILPTPTYGDWQARDNDVPAAIARRRAAAPMSDDDREEFEQTAAYDEWRDGFEPMMCYAWPVSLAYGVGEQEAADLIERFGGACSLIEFSEETCSALYGGDSYQPEYGIALTGGGMNLSDHIAAAYLACGCIPPERILSQLSGVISADKARRIGLRRAFREASAYYRRTAANLGDQARRIFAKRER